MPPRPTALSPLVLFSRNDAGQAKLYRDYVRERWALPHENPPLGLVGTRLGELKFVEGYPDKDTVQKVYDDLDFQRGSRQRIVRAFAPIRPAGAVV